MIMIFGIWLTIMIDNYLIMILIERNRYFFFFFFCFVFLHLSILFAFQIYNNKKNIYRSIIRDKKTRIIFTYDNRLSSHHFLSSILINYCPCCVSVNRWRHNEMIYPLSRIRKWNRYLYQEKNIFLKHDNSATMVSS